MFDEEYYEEFLKFKRLYDGKYIPTLGRKVGYPEIALAGYMCSGKLDTAKKLLEAGFVRENLSHSDSIKVFMTEEDELVMSDGWEILQDIKGKDD
ncbi:hypothetical protein HK096_001915 [Nowakowskiella sp. JEL0078]|nr:hypothetical protein HK096_001915 [Nowakowskiella sp. JEL0078]